MKALRQLVGYACVGLGTFLLDYGLFLLFAVICNMHYVTSHTVARIISATVNFFLNRHLIFKPGSGLLAEAVKYALTALFVLVATAGLLCALVEYAGLKPALAKPLAGLIMFMVSFVTLKTVVFTGKQ